MPASGPTAVVRLTADAATLGTVTIHNPFAGDTLSPKARELLALG